MKKALVISIEAPTYSSLGMIDGFRQHFEQVEAVNWQALRFNGGYDFMWLTIFQTCEVFKPDLIFMQFQHGEAVPAEKVKQLSEYAPVVNYTEDVRDDVGWIEQMHPHLSLSVFTNKDDAEKMKSLGFNSMYHHVSYNHVWYKPQPASSTNYGDIVFLGNNYKDNPLNFPMADERQKIISVMKQVFGNRFKAYGLGQENRMLNPQEAIECYNNCKIAISFNNFKRAGYQSDRFTNATGCGALTMYEYGDYPYGNIAACAYQNIYHLADLCNLIAQ
jgi:spore maturation protein CgeB